MAFRYVMSGEESALQRVSMVLRSVWKAQNVQTMLKRLSTLEFHRVKTFGECVAYGEMEA